MSMTPSSYLDLIAERLAGSYNREPPRDFGGCHFPLYARSHVVVGQYILHKALTYERMELNEHVLCHVLPQSPTPEQVSQIVRSLRDAVDRLVKPSHEHMSSALTAVLVSEHGFSPEAARKVESSGFTRHFRLGLQGWCFLRLLAVDLSSSTVWANRRGKEVITAYRPA